jgi:hypothetical protein
MGVDLEDNPVTPNEVSIRKSVAKLADVYKPWTTRQTEVYVQALSDLWPENVEAGVLATLRDWANHSAPSPGYVRERAVAHRTGASTSATRPARGPVAFHQARLPMRVGGDGYFRDAEGRFVLADPEAVAAWYADGGDPSAEPAADDWREQLELTS